MRVARLAVFACALTASGFQPPVPAKTGTVTGRVVEAHSGDPATPVRKALVILRSGQEAGTAVYSDDKGNYRIEMEPGAYTVKVERDGYVPAPQSETRTIAVRAGETTTDVNPELVRTGAISGRIVGPDGEPLPHASVQLRSTRGKKSGAFPGAVTDDRGVYRIFQIPPGKYFLFAAYQAGFEIREIKLQTPGGKAEDSYAVTYFPGTPDLAQAAAIEVQAGADLAGSISSFNACTLSAFAAGSAAWMPHRFRSS